MNSTNPNITALADMIRQRCVSAAEVNLPQGWKSDRRISVSRLLGNMDGRRTLLAAVQSRLNGKFFNTIVGGGPVNFTLAMTCGIALGSSNVFSMLTREQGLANPYTFDLTTGISETLPYLGTLPSGPQDVLIVDDVAASGTNIRRVFDACKYLGLRVRGIMPIVDTSPDDNINRFCQSEGIDYFGLVTSAMLQINPATAPPGYASKLPQATPTEGTATQGQKQAEQQPKPAEANTSGGV
jgi:orotate phosphoribosyltransferase